MPGKISKGNRAFAPARGCLRNVVRRIPSPASSTLNPLAEEFVPRTQRDAKKQMIVDIEGMLDCLKDDPGVFDEYRPLFVDKVNKFKSDKNYLQNVVGAVFNNSVIEPCLSYNGSRLCFQLSQEVVPDGGSRKIFQELFFQKCQVEFRNKETHSPARLHGMTQFFGELYSQWHANASDATMRNKFGELLCQLLNFLLDIADNDYVKSVVNVLKLTGKNLQEEFASTTTVDNYFEEVFLKLKNILDHRSVEEKTLTMVANVLKRRESNWETEEEEGLAQNAGKNRFWEDTVVGGHYFTNYGPSPPSVYGGGNYDELFPELANPGQFYRHKGSEVEDGMTDEMYDEFEKFLRL